MFGWLDLRPHSGTGSRLLELARTDYDAAFRALNELEPEAQARACLEVQPEQRHRLLELLEEPAEVVPLLPEVELVRTLIEGGLADTHWLLAHASAPQRVACVDLHCWKDGSFDARRFRQWLDALIEAGSEEVIAALEELDLEIWVLALRDLGHLSLTPSDFAESEDGLLYFSSESAADADRIRELFRTCLTEAPSHYLRLVTALFNEDPFDSEEHALRWHAARMTDLGFPSREEAMRAYTPLRPEDAHSARASSGATDEVARDGALVTASKLLESALQELPGERADEIQAAMLAVGNTLAVADRRDLSCGETGAECLRRALRGIELGLRILCEQRGRAPHEVLSVTLPLDLFRVGHTRDPSLGRSSVPREGEPQEEGSDPLYDALLELIGEE